MQKKFTRIVIDNNEISVKGYYNNLSEFEGVEFDFIKIPFTVADDESYLTFKCSSEFLTDVVDLINNSLNQS